MHEAGWAHRRWEGGQQRVQEGPLSVQLLRRGAGLRQHLGQLLPGGRVPRVPVYGSAQGRLWRQPLHGRRASALPAAASYWSDSWLPRSRCSRSGRGCRQLEQRGEQIRAADLLAGSGSHHLAAWTQSNRQIGLPGQCRPASRRCMPSCLRRRGPVCSPPARAAAVLLQHLRPERGQAIPHTEDQRELLGDGRHQTRPAARSPASGSLTEWPRGSMPALHGLGTLRGAWPCLQPPQVGLSPACCQARPGRRPLLPPRAARTGERSSTQPAGSRQGQEPGDQPPWPAGRLVHSAGPAADRAHRADSIARLLGEDPRQPLEPPQLWTPGTEMDVYTGPEMRGASAAPSRYGGGRGRSGRRQPPDLPQHAALGTRGLPGHAGAPPRCR